MAEKAPMIGVVISPSLKARLTSWQVASRRKSFSEFCALLLEYAEKRLEKAGGLDSLLREEGILAERPDLSPSGRELVKRQTKLAKGVHEQHARSAQSSEVQHRRIKKAS